MALQLVAGKVPFISEALYDLITKHLTEPPPPLRTLKPEVEAQKRRFLALKVDLAQPENIERMVEDAVKAMGRIDILANIAGVNVHKAAEEMTEKDWDFVLDVNLKALFFCCQAVGKVMLRQGSGRIINMSSSFGVVGFGVYRWWDKIAPAGRSSQVSINPQEVKNAIDAGKPSPDQAADVGRGESPPQAGSGRAERAKIPSRL